MEGETLAHPRRRTIAQKLIAGPGARTMALVVPRVPSRGALRWFWFDGLAGNFAESILLTFIPLYALALGASNAQIGWLSSAGALIGTAMLLPGARLAERWGRPHRLVVLAVAAARLSVLALALWPLAGRAGVAVVIVLATLRVLLHQLALPAWTALAAEIVPSEIRGRYFASRNMVMAIAAAIAVPLAGRLIERVGGVEGYRAVFAIAAGMGLLATFAYSRVRGALPQPAAREIPGNRFPLLDRLRRRGTLVAFCAHALLWSLALQLSAPFFNVFLKRELATPESTIGLLATVSVLASLPGQQLFGTLSDRWGARRTLLITGALIPFAPLAWLFVTQPLHVIPINLWAGFLWAGFNIASFNYLLDVTPDLNRPRYVALYNTVVGVGAAAGAALGGVIADLYSFQTLFLLSAIGRAGAVVLFWGLSRGRTVERDTGSRG